MAARKTIRFMLVEGRPMAIGRAREVAALVLAHPRRAPSLVECLWDEDRGVANRAADALEHISRERPSILEPWSASLLGLLGEATESRLRWNLVQIIPRLSLKGQEIRRAVGLLEACLEDRSSIVKTSAMQSLADLARRDHSMVPEALDLLRIHTRSGTPAMRARGRKLLKILEPAGVESSARNRSRRAPYPG
jgi:hypothetical protein